MGKALYARTIIEIIFGLWALLAILRPAYRPPRSWLLILLALSLGVAILAACFGVSVQRSFWSTYERNAGRGGPGPLVCLHCRCGVRGPNFPGLGAFLLNLNLGVSLIVALLALSQYSANVGSSLFAFSPYRESASFGNPTYLGTYMLVNVILALGFLIRSFIPSAVDWEELFSPALGREMLLGRHGTCQYLGPRLDRRGRSSDSSWVWASQQYYFCFWRGGDLFGWPELD